MQGRTMKIGTRGSPLALVQARLVQRLLSEAHGLAVEQLEIVVIRTSGDRIQDRPLSEVGGKGLFTKEIEEALLANEVDLAVHSMKDMATALPDGLAIGAVLEREDVRDAFISKRYATMAELPAGAVVGSSSLRRAAQIRKFRPDIKVIEFRGNVETRLAKLDAGVADATFLACAGLNRLGKAHVIREAVPIGVMLPAVAQGAIAIEVRSADQEMAGLVHALDHAASRLAVDIERAYLGILEGSCRTPIGGHAVVAGDGVILRGEILRPDGSAHHAGERSGTIAQAANIAADLARALLGKAGPGFFG